MSEAKTKRCRSCGKVLFTDKREKDPDTTHCPTCAMRAATGKGREPFGGDAWDVLRYDPAYERVWDQNKDGFRVEP